MSGYIYDVARISSFWGFSQGNYHIADHPIWLEVFHGRGCTHDKYRVQQFCYHQSWDIVCWLYSQERVLQQVLGTCSDFRLHLKIKQESRLHLHHSKACMHASGQEKYVPSTRGIRGLPILTSRHCLAKSMASLLTPVSSCSSDEICKWKQIRKNHLA